MTKRIRRYGDFQRCPSCNYLHDSSSWSNHHNRQLWIKATKSCSPNSCADSEYRHKHMHCEKCDAKWLDCWREDRVPWWSRWWYRMTHLSEQMSRESDELNSD